MNDTRTAAISEDELRELDESFRVLAQELRRYDISHNTKLESLFDKETTKIGKIIEELHLRFQPPPVT